MALGIKDPEAQVDYSVDWSSDYLDGQFIVASQWSIEPAEAGGMTIVSASHNLTQAAVQVAGGVAGRRYTLTNHVALNDGQVDERSIAVRVEAR